MRSSFVTADEGPEGQNVMQSRYWFYCLKLFKIDSSLHVHACCVCVCLCMCMCTVCMYVNLYVLCASSEPVVCRFTAVQLVVWHHLSASPVHPCHQGIESLKNEHRPSRPWYDSFTEVLGSPAGIKWLSPFTPPPNSLRNRFTHCV